MTKVTIGSVVLGDPDEPDPSPSAIEWSYTHRIVEYPIPGYKDKTQRTSNKVLLHIFITTRTVTKDKFKKLQNLIEDAGPYLVQTPMWRKTCYLKDGKFAQKKGEEDYVGDWTLTLVEAND